MKPFIKRVIFLLIFLAPLTIHAQEQAKKEDNKAPASSRVQRRAARLKWKKERRAEMDDKKAVKEYHKRLQTKQTLKRMKREKKKSDRLRANKREFFLVRWFRRS